jgi:hypothetical protein
VHVRQHEPADDCVERLFVDVVREIGPDEPKMRQFGAALAGREDRLVSRS